MECFQETLILQLLTLGPKQNKHASTSRVGVVAPTYKND
uniref:Uncharacterized protein n=1 Tax=Rhizophora mucronata TaxID=61149 RepID=A0A2P2KVS1_RHIMU